MATRYWIAVASREHVLHGVEQAIAQVCHGKSGHLKRMAPGDWIIYYSPTQKFGEKIPCQCFTAIGRVKPGEPYQCAMSNDFIPWRRNIEFVSSHEVAIKPLLAKLSFIHDQQRWGFIFRRGFFQINEHDFNLIATSMGVMHRE